MITSRKITAFTKKVADLPDKTSGAFTAAQAKAQFDAAPEELRVAHNGLIDDLGAITAGDSGAKAIGVSPIAGVTGTNVQAVVEDLKLQVNGAVTGSIPDGSITQAKLAFTIATNAASVTIADTGNHFTETNVEGALDELFQSASSVKTNVANAIGAPATSSDTGTVLANRITTEKGRLAAEIGDGNNTSTLQYLADRLIVRSDAISTQVNAKGVASTSADTLAQLATKIGQIATKLYAEGNGTWPANNTGAVSVTGLSFTPKFVIFNGAGVSVDNRVVLAVKADKIAFRGTYTSFSANDVDAVSAYGIGGTGGGWTGTTITLSANGFSLDTFDFQSASGGGYSWYAFG